MSKKRSLKNKKVEAIKHGDARRKNIPTAETEALVDLDEKSPLRVAYERRNPDLEPQLVWRGKGVEVGAGQARSPRPRGCRPKAAEMLGRKRYLHYNRAHCIRVRAST